MHILADNQQRLLSRQPLKLIEKGGKCLSPLLRRAQTQRRTMVVGGNRKESRNERCRLGDLLCSKRQHCLELVELLPRRVVRPDAGGALELRDKGMERTVDMVGRTLISHPAVSPQRGALGQRCDNARLADARFA